MANTVRIDFSGAKGDYPLANSEACRMIAKAFEDAAKDPNRGWSQRYIAKTLGYKTSVVLSHMANGRAPIPVDRAVDIARLLKMDNGAFLMAVLEQRHPDIDFKRIFASLSRSGKSAAPVSGSILLEELEAIAGMSLDDLPVQTVNVLREIIADRNGARRVLRMSEVPLIEHIRKAHPEGLSPADMRKVQDYIGAL